MTNDALINMSKVQKHLNDMADNARDNGYPHEVEVIQSVQDNLLDFVEENRAALANPVDVDGLKKVFDDYKRENHSSGYTFDDFCNHLAAQGLVGGAKSERQVLCEALGRIGWDEIKAFKDELRKGQSVYEDAGGYFNRAISRLFGIAPRNEVVTYRQAAQKLIDELTAAPKNGVKK